MATAEQIKSLIKSHFSEQPERFYTMALQVAAHEALNGHEALAHDIRKIIDIERKKKGAQIISLPKDLSGLVLTEEAKYSLSSLVISNKVRAHIDQIILEYINQDKLKSYGLSNRRKLLLVGPPGTGKTMTANVLAKELGLSLNIIQVDRLVTKFMGETSVKLRDIFNAIRDHQAVYLFDEFDAIGGERSSDNDVGEMRRVLNSFLQFIEQDISDSFIISVTNNPGLLDNALFRRFDDVLKYSLPDNNERETLIKNVLGLFYNELIDIKKISNECEGLSHADIDSACMNAIKLAILTDQTISSESILSAISYKKEANINFKGI